MGKRHHMDAFDKDEVVPTVTKSVTERKRERTTTQCNINLSYKK